MKVLICGAGIAGTALALWLSKLDHEVVVIERYPTLRATGLQIDLRGHGIEVMKRMGIEEQVLAKTVKEEGFEVVKSNGRRVAWFPANHSKTGVQSFTSEWEIRRGDLVEVLYDASKKNVDYRFGVTIQSVQQHDDRIEVVFSNDTSEKFDLLIGADGQGSRTRKLMLGPGVEDPIHFIDTWIAYFTIPRPIREGEKYIATSHFAPGGRTIMIRRHNPSHIQVYLGAGSDQPQFASVRKGDIKAEKEAFASIYSGVRWQMPEILAAMKDSEDFYCERPGLVRLSSWWNNRIALVGDAAYSPTVNTGMGTTSSLVGAYILAGEIGRSCGASASQSDITTALESYDKKFRPFMDQVQRGVAKEENNWAKVMPTSAFGIAILHWFLWLVTILKIDILGKFVLHEEVRDWSLPDYEEMTGRRDNGSL